MTPSTTRPSAPPSTPPERSDRCRWWSPSPAAGRAAAGWSPATAAPHDKDAFIGTVELNATTTFNVARLAAAAMAANEADEHGQRGVIVNTGSIAGMEGQIGQVGYSAGKAAILGMTLPMARDLGAIGVRVCAIAPGTMGTPLMLSVPQEMQDKLVGDVVFPNRMGRPEEYAALVHSIATNPYLNGENIRLDGALRFPPK